MVILVTGVTGFLGSNHLRNLISNEGIRSKDIRVLVMKNEPIDELKKLGVEIFTGDLQFPNTLKGIAKDVTIVYHIGAIAINSAANREIMMKVNRFGTVALANEFLKEESAEKFVYASSYGVYGYDFPKYPVKEDYRKKPANNYQESKLLAEQDLFKLYNENDLNVTAIRNSMILGPRDTLTSFRVCQGLLDGNIPYIGNGKNLLSFTDARDSSNAMILTTKKSISKGEAYNIKSFDITQREYFDNYAEACGGCYPKKQYPYWLAYSFAWFRELTTPKGKEVLVDRTRVDRYSVTRMLDSSKIQEQLGYKPQYIDAKKSINDAVVWLVENNYIQLSKAKHKIKDE